MKNEKQTGVLGVTIGTRFSAETAARIASEAKRRSELAGVTVKPSAVVRSLVEHGLKGARQ